MQLLPFRSGSRIPERLVWTSVALTVVVAVEAGIQVAFPSIVDGNVLSVGFLVGLLTTVPFVVVLAYAGYWLAESEVDEARHRRVWRWTVAGVAVSVLLNVLMMAVLPFWSLLVALGWLRWAVAVGASIGVLIGVTEARAIQKVMEAERSAVRAEHLEVQRDLLDYLNSLLRHEVLNASNVISGYAELLAEEHDEGTDGYEYSETVRRKSEEITTVIEDVRVLLQATDGYSSLEPVDLVGVLQRETGKLGDLDESAVVHVDAPESLEVPADALLPRVFGNLLANAVEHNDSDLPEVSVTVEEHDDAAVVEIADNGPGISGDEVESLFERPSQQSVDHGLGLYLVQELVHHYGGRVALIETGPEGSVFRVELPREPGETVDSVGVDAVETPESGFADASDVITRERAHDEVQVE